MSDVGKHVSKGEFNIVLLPLIALGLVVLFIVVLLRSVFGWSTDQDRSGL